MSRKITIGSPELTGSSANAQCAALFQDAPFPAVIRLTNHLPRALSFPEASVYMMPLGGKCEAKIKAFSELQRLVSSIEQIALLNKHAEAVTLEDIGGIVATAPSIPVQQPSQPATGRQKGGQQQPVQQDHVKPQTQTELPVEDVITPEGA